MNRLKRWAALAFLFGTVLVAHDIIASRAAVWQWSTTPATNATADPTINWAEGMPPGAVNDSARAMMARLADWRDDLSGSHFTDGTSTAYTLTTNQAFPNAAAADGQKICFSVHVTNDDSPTLAVDSVPAAPFQFGDNGSLQAGVLIANSPYCARYVASIPIWQLESVYNDGVGVPLGTLLDYTGSTAPSSSFALAYGQAISRTTYANYFTLVGTTYGAGDGSTTFNIPDLRGRTVYGVDNMGGSAANRITSAGGNFDGTSLGSAGGAQNHTLALSEAPTGQFSFNFNDPGHSHTINSLALFNTSGASPVISFTNASSTPVSHPSTDTATTGITASITDHAGGGSHTVLSPGMVLNKIIRIQ